MTERVIDRTRACRHPLTTVVSCTLHSPSRSLAVRSVALCLGWLTACVHGPTVATAVRISAVRLPLVPRASLGPEQRQQQQVQLSSERTVSESRVTRCGQQSDGRTTSWNLSRLLLGWLWLLVTTPDDLQALAATTMAVEDARFSKSEAQPSPRPLRRCREQHTNSKTSVKRTAIAGSPLPYKHQVN